MSHRRIALMSATVAAALAFAPGAALAAPAKATAPPASSVEKVTAYVAPSIVYVDLVWTGTVHDDAHGTWLNSGRPFQAEFQCTGFVVNPNGYVGTAGHCVNYDAEVQSAIEAQGAQWAITNSYYNNPSLSVQDILGFNDFSVHGTDGTGTPTLAPTLGWSSAVSGVDVVTAKAARIISSQKFDDGDAALLKVEATNLNALPVVSGTPAQVGEDVVSVGYPASVDSVTDSSLKSPSFTAGNISSIRSIDNGAINVYEMSAALSGGMSGGPMVDSSGRVIGMNSFKNASESQQFNFGMPSDRISELLHAAGVPNQLSAATTDYRKGLDAYFAGKKKQAVDALTKVTKEQPANGLAASYLQKAQALPNSGGSNIAMLIGIIAGAAVVIGGVVFAVLRLRKRGGTPTTTPEGTPDAAPSPVAVAEPAPAPTPPTPVEIPAQKAAPRRTTRAKVQPVIEEDLTVDLTEEEDAPVLASAGAVRKSTSSGAARKTTTATRAKSNGTSTTRATLCKSCKTPLARSQKFCGSCGTPR